MIAQPIKLISCYIQPNQPILTLWSGNGSEAILITFAPTKTAEEPGFSAHIVFRTTAPEIGTYDIHDSENLDTEAGSKMPRIFFVPLKEKFGVGDDHLTSCSIVRYTEVPAP